jgi:hypothetical protein
MPLAIGNRFVENVNSSVRVWIGLMWLRIGSSGALVWTRHWTFGFHKSVDFIDQANWGRCWNCYCLLSRWLSLTSYILLVKCFGWVWKFNWISVNHLRRYYQIQIGPTPCPSEISGSHGDEYEDARLMGVASTRLRGAAASQKTVIFNVLFCLTVRVHLSPCSTLCWYSTPRYAAGIEAVPRHPQYNEGSCSNTAWSSWKGGGVHELLWFIPDSSVGPFVY